MAVFLLPRQFGYVISAGLGASLLMVEDVSHFYFLLTMGGVSHPILAGAAGWMWVVGGSFSYSNSDPDNSSWVFKVSLPFRWLGMLTLFGCSCHTALQTFN